MAGDPGGARRDSVGRRALSGAGPSASVADGADDVAQPAPAFRDQALVHLDALYGFALYLSRRPADAQDLVQETYLRAFRFAHRFEPGTHLRAWLFQILRNTFLTFYRREARELAVLDKDGVDGYEEAWEAEGPAPSSIAIVDLERAITELPEEFRSVLLLSDLEGLTLLDIARIMETPVGTVKSRLFRARRLMRRRLADYQTG